MTQADCLIFPKTSTDTARTTLEDRGIDVRPAPAGGLHAFFDGEAWTPATLVALLAREGAGSRAVAL